MPRFFNNVKNIDEIKGVYVPFWLFSSNVTGYMAADCKKISTWTMGDYLYTKVDRYNVVREGEFSFKKIPQDGSVKFNDKIMNNLEPFDYSKLKPFNYSYLSGFLAEKYDLDDKAVKDIIEKRISESISVVLKGELLNYSSILVTGENNTYNVMDSEYVLLPVYMLNVKYKNKLYLFAYNGESGKIIGDVPISFIRGFTIFLIIFAICFGICILIFFLFFRSV